FSPFFCLQFFCLESFLLALSVWFRLRRAEDRRALPALPAITDYVGIRRPLLPTARPHRPALAQACLRARETPPSWRSAEVRPPREMTDFYLYYSARRGTPQAQPRRAE